jgi:tetratricopeptide (TPR) repeat protein
MPPRELIGLERSNESNLLWPTLSDAVDTFLKRRASGAEAYERTWRLIHVWEAIAISIASAAVARLRGHDAFKSQYLKCREQMHGRTWNDFSKSFDRFQGALDGSATARHNILWEISNHAYEGSAFLSAMRAFLVSPVVHLEELAQGWSRICDVPNEARGADAYTVREALRHVNTFRNRIAHVPFPYDGLEAVATALENATEELFSADPKPWQSFQSDDRLESPLTGSLLWRGRSLRGNMPYRAATDSEDAQFCFPPLAKKDGDPERWGCAPFIHIDAMLRPYVLTRLRSEASGVWEFTRFRAEANSVLTREEPKWLGTLPSPTEVEYDRPTDKQEQKAETEALALTDQSEGVDALAGAMDENAKVVSTFEEALRLVRNDDYEPAIQYFERLVANKPEYHIGWLRLGNAQREWAMRLRLSDPFQADRVFTDAIESLSRASGHIDAAREAQAFYERSKAFYHRGRLLASDGDLGQSLRDARKAFSLAADTSYQSWIAYLEQHGVTDAL